MRKSSPLSLCLSLLVLFSVIPFSLGKDTISGTEILRDGETLESPNQRFVLGFFSPKDSMARYLGIWFSVNSTTVVWVANRRTPIEDTSGFLSFKNGGQLELSGSNQSIWSPDSTVSTDPTARLLDNGNFVLQAGDNPEYLWQSFDFPTDTLLPGMKLGPDFINKRDRNLTSWKNESDPSPGEYTYKMDNNGEAGQPYLIRTGSEIIFRSGPWNGIEFSGHVRMRTFKGLEFAVVFNSNESYYQYIVTEASALTRLVVEPARFLTRFSWDEEMRQWKQLWSAPDESVCDNYQACGPNSVCNSGSTELCRCLEGFEPNQPQDWADQRWVAGCRRMTPLTCRHDGDGFLRKDRMKLPDTSNAIVNRSMRFDGCQESCLSSCSCVAFAPANIEEGDSGCIIWNGDLVDIRNYSNGGQDLYIRLEKDDLAQLALDKQRTRAPLIIGLAVGTTALILIVAAGCVFWRIKMKNVENSTAAGSEGWRNPVGLIEEEIDLPLFSVDEIMVATNNFASINKIGRGGFGEVYKGVLSNGEDIAVKRLSRHSCQGIGEFKNEVMLIAKLQHKNLVKLLGCCFQEDEKILVYEYMANKSLDSILFDIERKSLLDWEKRFSIIEGVSRGLLYLHRDSRLKIVHRDLKAANILLDQEMNPKISDFGMARMFVGNQNEDNTNRVVGTYGYMSPEYAMEGVFSEKSDVYSFGVLVLEILSGRKAARAWTDKNFGLLRSAWKLWEEGRPEDLIDPCMLESCDLCQAIRCLHIGLLCVQNIVQDRPTMSTVVLFLSSKVLIEESPQIPTFHIENGLNDTLVQTLNDDHFSANEVTISMFSGR